MAEIRIGALPYIMKGGSVYIMIITSSSGKNWIVPRGRRESKMNDSEVARMEALEEAGVTGSISPKISGSCTIQSGGRDKLKLTIYPLKIDKVMKKWEESSFRKRKLLKLNDALDKIDEKPLCKCLQQLARKI
jgi:8-oxo-dGTP pyrophosphatase MutT (NUDIX family)